MTFDGLEVLRLVPRSAIPKLQHAAGNSSETHRLGFGVLLPIQWLE